MEDMDEKERLAQKDAYIAEHLMDLQPDTLRFLVADLEFHTRKLTALCDGYRGERDALGEAIGKAVVSAGIASDMAMTGPMLILMLQGLEEDHKRLAAALTRARAEGMEEAAKIAERSCDDCAADIRATIREKENQ